MARTKQMAWGRGRGGKPATFPHGGGPAPPGGPAPAPGGGPAPGGKAPQRWAPQHRRVRPRTGKVPPALRIA